MIESCWDSCFEEYYCPNCNHEWPVDGYAETYDPEGAPGYSAASAKHGSGIGCNTC